MPLFSGTKNTSWNIYTRQSLRFTLDIASPPAKIFSLRTVNQQRGWGERRRRMRRGQARKREAGGPKPRSEFARLRSALAAPFLLRRTHERLAATIHSSRKQEQNAKLAIVVGTRGNTLISKIYNLTSRRRTFPRTID